jgi:putative transposase
MATHLRTELVTAALDMAAARRRHRAWARPPLGPGYPVHQPRLRAPATRPGSRFHGIDRRLLRQRHGRGFFATLEVELIDRSDWASQAEARAAVFEYIEVFYNRIRRHSGIGNLPPAEFEDRYRSIEATRAV